MKKIGSMSFDELVETKAKIEAAIEIKVASERRQLMEMLGEIGSEKRSANGAAGRRTRSDSLKGRKLPPLYRNPKNRNETWAGRGNRPRWLVAALKSGKKLEAFAIR
jgi:DNA-binding protein H-NS